MSLRSKRVIKLLSLLLVVCLCVSIVLAPPAHAELVAAAFVVGAVAIVGATLIAMGIRPGASHFDFDSLRSGVIAHLQGVGLVTADGKITVYGLGAGITVVGGAVISAIRDYLFSGSESAVAPLSAGIWSGLSTSGDLVWSGSSGRSWTSTVPCRFVAVYSPDYSADGLVELACVSLLVGDMVLNGIHNPLTIPISGGFCCYIGRYYQSDSSFPLIPHISSSSSYPQWDFVLSPAPSTSLDLDLSGAQSLDSSDAPDVIYPGWAEDAQTVDAPIDVDLDHDGAIDNVVPADKYYPITVPLDGTDVYDWTQDKAQAGTDTKVIDATQDDVASDSKTGSYSYTINSAGSYTFQVKDFFPFCIPFDIYDMLSCLAADPVAPKFDWTIPVLGHSYTVSIDLSAFNGVASILRTMELLAFAVGLAFASKRLIQGGD